MYQYETTYKRRAVRQVVVAIPPALKPRIGELLKKCPDDLRSVRRQLSRKRTTGGVQHATYNVRRAACNLQRTTYDWPHCNLQRTTYDWPHATCNATIHVQQAAYTIA